jgi:hypothetical protein
MYIWNSVLGQLSNLAGHSQVEPEVNATQQILMHIKGNKDSGNVKDLAENLKGLCGPEGYVKINCYNANLQVHLFFASEVERNMALPILASYCEANYSSNRFMRWQLRQEGDESDLFPLKLSTNQSVALLEIDPRETGTFCHGQAILKNVKELYEAERFSLMGLPGDLLAKICSHLPIEAIGGFSLTSRIALKIFNENVLWTLFAEIHSIQLVQTGDSALKQVKSARLNVIQALATLPEDSPFQIDHVMDFACATREKIEQMGGICLSQKTFDWRDDFVGIVLHKEGDKYFLVLCSGAGNMRISEDDYDSLMPEAIAKLRELDILPDYLCGAIGRHPQDTLPNFKAWQRKHQKPSS